MGSKRKVYSPLFVKLSNDLEGYRSVIVVLSTLWEIDSFVKLLADATNLGRIAVLLLPVGFIYFRDVPIGREVGNRSNR